jgi:hypothetical protein
LLPDSADAESPDARDLLADAAERRCPDTPELRRRAGRKCHRPRGDGSAWRGWALSQVVTLVAPEVIVLGGGVSLVDASLFLEPVRRYVAQYVFPPLAGRYAIVPARLGEEVVVHGALALAASLKGT